MFNKAPTRCDVTYNLASELPRVQRCLQTPSVRVLIFFYSVLHALPEATGISVIAPVIRRAYVELSRSKQESRDLNTMIYIYIKYILSAMWFIVSIAEESSLLLFERFDSTPYCGIGCALRRVLIACRISAMNKMICHCTKQPANSQSRQVHFSSEIKTLASKTREHSSCRKLGQLHLSAIITDNNVQSSYHHIYPVVTTTGNHVVTTTLLSPHNTMWW